MGDSKLQISFDTMKWLSGELTNIEFIVSALKKHPTAVDFDGVEYDMDDLEFLEKKLAELKQRSRFEETNLKKLRNGF